MVITATLLKAGWDQMVSEKHLIQNKIQKTPKMHQKASFLDNFVWKNIKASTTYVTLLLQPVRSCTWMDAGAHWLGEPNLSGIFFSKIRRTKTKKVKMRMLTQKAFMIIVKYNAFLIFKYFEKKKTHDGLGVRAPQTREASLETSHLLIWQVRPWMDGL
jgi:hypothetical protein